MRRAVCLIAILLAGCAGTDKVATPTIGAASAFMLLQKSSYLKMEYLAGIGLAYALYDPFAPNWDVTAVPVDDDHMRLEMHMKALHTGGEGEALQVFKRSAERIVQEGKFASYEVLSYDEGVDSSGVFASRVANGEIRLIKSRTFPSL